MIPSRKTLPKSEKIEVIEAITEYPTCLGIQILRAIPQTIKGHLAGHFISVRVPPSPITQLSPFSGLHVSGEYIPHCTFSIKSIAD
jgi:hypothetical protein